VTVQTFLDQATKRLKRAGIGTARLDCLVLLEDVMATDRASLLAHPEREMNAEHLQQLEKMVAQRAEHIPLAQVRGKTEFYGREFIITPAVLEPRPESETMIELLLNLPLDSTKKVHIVDVGAGSGAIGITAVLELPDARVSLVDIDEAALMVAAQNAARFELDLPCIVDDLLSHAAKRGAKPDILLANLPYVPDSYQINTAALHEPRIAIFGGPDGLDLYRRLFMQCETLQPTYVMTESLPFQHTDLAAIANAKGYQLLQTADFIQVFVPDGSDQLQVAAVKAIPESLASTAPAANSTAELPTSL